MAATIAANNIDKPNVLDRERQLTMPDNTEFKNVVLAGNPNVGKSVVFNVLTGLYANVSNFPGTTVDISRGVLPNGLPIKDTPGVYGLGHYSEEEEVAAKHILSADVVINVISAPTLERDLFLTQQIIDYEKPMLVLLNQMDELPKNHLEIDAQKLAQLLGVPVLPCVAVKNEGLENITAFLNTAKQGRKTPDSPHADALEKLESMPVECLQIYGARRQHINHVVNQVLTKTKTQIEIEAKKISFSQQLGQWFMNPIIGSISGLAVLWMLYQIVGVWVAKDLVNLTEKTWILEGLMPPIQKTIQSLLPATNPLYQILAGEFGLLTMTLQYLLGVMLPLVLGFYFYVSLLEDCGYLPRLAVLSDSMLSKIGLNGRAVIPIILGFGCVTMASVATRVLTSQRERTIASVILAITIPCSAQIAVLVGLMAAAGGVKAWFAYIGILAGILTILGTVLNKILPGRSTSLMMDLPPLRMPQLKNVAKKTWTRTIIFLKEAAPLFLVGSLIVSIAQITGVLSLIEGWIAPLTVNMLHLPQQAGDIFVMGLVRRDFGAAGLYALADHLTALQIITSLIVITLFVPCFASATVIFKERGFKESTAILLGSWALAFMTGAVVTRVLALTGLFT